MGGSGGGFFPSRPRDVEDLLNQTLHDDDQKHLEGAVNLYLQELLIDFNDRDPSTIHSHLDEIQKIVGDLIDLEGFLFGGSVSKHTYVDGLSDVDVLAIVNKEKWLSRDPGKILKIMHRYLKNKLTADKVKSVEKGQLAITINYNDGTQVQILPAIKSGKKIFINEPRNKGWNETIPMNFVQKLRDLNGKLNNMLVPTIKLAKAIIYSLPEQKRTSGYHTENLAIEVFQDYKGPCTGKAMLQYYFDNAGEKVLKTIKDITNQSKTVDSYLGAANSTERKVVADGYASVSRKINGSYSLEQWKKLFGD